MNQRHQKVSEYFFFIFNVFILEVTIPDHQYTFDEIRTKFEELFYTVAPLIVNSIPSLEMLKRFLTTHFPELKPQLDIAESFDNILNVVKGMCTIINIKYLETIVDHYNIVEAKAHITAYKLVVDKFCEEEKLSMCQNINFLKGPSSVQTPSLVLALDGNPDEITISDIIHLLEKVSGIIGDAELQLIKVEGRGPITVTCRMSKLPNMDLFEKNFESKLLLLFNLKWLILVILV